VTLALGLFLLTTPMAAAQPSPSAPPGPTPITAGLYLATGDSIEGWSWLRDDAGCAYATWSFFGAPFGGPVVVQLGLLATDATNGGPGVDGQAWVTIGPLVDGAPGPASFGPVPLTLPNVSSADDPVGYQTAASVTIAADELGPDATGIWVLVERRGPTGEAIPVHLATTREAVTVTGLSPIARPDASPAG
jgi:hypothetical protein